MTEDKNWFEIPEVLIIKNIGNRGLSRGINLSRYTNKTDIGREVRIRILYVKEGPSNEERERASASFIAPRYSDKIIRIKHNCALNMIAQSAEGFGLQAELYSTDENIQRYFELYYALRKPQKVDIEVQIDEAVKRRNELEEQLKVLSIDVYEMFRGHSNGEEMVREQYPKETYSLDKELDAVVEKTKLEKYKPLRKEFLELKQKIRDLVDKRDAPDDYDSEEHQHIKETFLQEHGEVGKVLLKAVENDLAGEYTQKYIAKDKERSEATMTRWEKKKQGKLIISR